MRHWAGGGAPEPTEVDEQYKAKAKRLGIDWTRLQPQQGDCEQPALAPEVHELWAEHHRTWDVLMHCANSWEWVAPAMSVPYRVGLPRAEVLAVLQMQRWPRMCWSQVLEGIRIAEGEALEVWERRLSRRT